MDCKDLAVEVDFLTILYIAGTLAGYFFGKYVGRNDGKLK